MSAQLSQAIGTSRVEFAHRSEAEFARILEYYGVRWQYEPRTFVLEQDAQGNLRESFTPDFYLPEFDLYIELTTLKQSLANRKHRKIRKLRRAHPEVNIKLFQLRDIHRLMVKYGRANSPKNP